MIKINNSPRNKAIDTLEKEAIGYKMIITKIDLIRPFKDRRKPKSKIERAEELYLKTKRVQSLERARSYKCQSDSPSRCPRVCF